jgi:hypothetical protein
MERAAVRIVGFFLKSGELVIELVGRVSLRSGLRACRANVNIVDLDPVKGIPGVLVAPKHDLAKTEKPARIKSNKVGRNRRVGTHLT